MTKNKNKKSSEAAKQEAFKLSDGICYCKTPADMISMSVVEWVVFANDRSCFHINSFLFFVKIIINEIQRKVKLHKK